MSRPGRKYNPFRACSALWFKLGLFEAQVKLRLGSYLGSGTQTAPGKHNASSFLELSPNSKNFVNFKKLISLGLVWLTG